MKILLISWYFPPVNDVAALRTGAMADYLSRRGHDVFVVTAARSGDSSLRVPLAVDHIIRTPWLDIDRWRVQTDAETVAKTRTAPPGRPKQTKRFAQLRARATQSYLNLIHIPDRQIGWLHFAVAAARDLASQHRFDLIYASGPPFTSHLIARSISRQFGVPWIAEYRDGWSRYFYTPRPKWRQAIDARMEAATIRSADGIVAVTEPWAEYYREQYRKPTAAIYNGFDATDVVETRRESAMQEPLSIVYMGVLYDGLRDPSPLYEAVRCSALRPDELRIVYYGPSDADVRPLAEKFGVLPFIDVKPRVSHAESLRIQRASDVLLLLQAPDDPRNVPAKLFEYFAAQRPILGLGLDNGIPATLIRDRRAGFYESDIDAIAQQLVRWSTEKRIYGRIAAIPDSALHGLSRAEQLEKLEQFLLSLQSPPHSQSG